MTRNEAARNYTDAGDDGVAAIIRAMAPVDMSAPFDRSKVAGKVIIITGGASGLGAAFAREWAAHGAYTIIADVNDVAGHELVAEMRRTSGSPHHYYFHCDVTDWTSQVEMFKAAVRASPTGGIDAVVPNAGIGTDGAKPDEPGSFEDPRDLDADSPPPPRTKVLDVNLTGALYTIHLAIFWLLRNPESRGEPRNDGKDNSEDHERRLREWRKKRDRHILLIGSIGGVMPLAGSPQYTASKHAITGLFRCLRLSCFWRGIRVNLLMPSFVDTPMISGGVLFALAGGGGKAQLQDVVEAATRFMADKDVCGRAVVVGPRMKVEDFGVESNAKAPPRLVAIDPETTDRGRSGVWPGSQAAWECYAHDYENIETFVYRYSKLVAMYAVMRGWWGWLMDVLALPFRRSSS